MENTINLSEIFDKKRFDRVLSRIKIITNLYFALNLITFKIFDGFFNKQAENTASKMIGDFFDKK